MPGIGMPQTYDNVLDYDKYVQNRPQPMTSTNIGLSSKTGKSLRSLNQTCDNQITRWPIKIFKIIETFFFSTNNQYEYCLGSIDGIHWGIE